MLGVWAQLAKPARRHAWTGKVGEQHHRAVLSDRETRLMLILRKEGYTMAWLAAQFDISKACVWSICSGRTRACSQGALS